MSNIDKRGKLEENPFSYFISKDGKLHISFHHKEVMVLKDNKASDLIRKMDQATDFEIQMLLAKATGNFKHGNERK